MDETPLDRSNQLEVAEYIHKRIVSRFPFVGHMITMKQKIQSGDVEDHDTDVWYSGYRVGIIEVKCRTRTAEWFEKEGYMIDRGKLLYLWKENKLGFKAMLAVRTSDGYVFTAMLEDLIAGRERWGVPTAAMMSTTNHGKDQRKESKEGHILPMDLFYNIGKLERFE
jgi:hypothetical protein